MDHNIPFSSPLANHNLVSPLPPRDPEYDAQFQRAWRSRVREILLPPTPQATNVGTSWTSISSSALLTPQEEADASKRDVVLQLQHRVQCLERDLEIRNHSSASLSPPKERAGLFTSSSSHFLLTSPPPPQQFDSVVQAQRQKVVQHNHNYHLNKEERQNSTPRETSTPPPDIDRRQRLGQSLKPLTHGTDINKVTASQLMKALEGLEDCLRHKGSLGNTPQQQYRTQSSLHAYDRDGSVVGSNTTTTTTSTAPRGNYFDTNGGESERDSSSRDHAPIHAATSSFPQSRHSNTIPVPTSFQRSVVAPSPRDGFRPSWAESKTVHTRKYTS